jgi:hypothetical protein
MDSLKVMVLTLILSIFFCVGVAHVAKPDWFIKRSGVLKGGELLTTWNRLSFRVAGALFAGFAIYLLYHLLGG